MKRLILAFSCLICFLPELKAQAYRGWAGEMFVYSQPNARTEAMGRGSAALTGSPFMSYYNPAASMFSGPVVVEFSRLDYIPSLKQSADKEICDNYGLGVNFGTFGAFSLNYVHFSGGGDLVNYNPVAPISLGPLPLYTDIYMLNYSFPVLRTLSVGMNVNYFNQKFWNNSPDGPKGWYFDLGLLKKFQFEPGPAGQQNLYLGLSFMNLSNTKFPAFFPGATLYFILPSAMRLASAYEIRPPGKISYFSFFKGLLTAEYYDLLNSRYHARFELGTELTFLEMLNLRAGWYSEELNNQGVNTVKSRLYELTYGFGLEAPLRKIPGISIPLDIRFDFTSLPFPEYYNNDSRHEYNSPIYSLNISYGI